jgi:hypothetical protein
MKAKQLVKPAADKPLIDGYRYKTIKNTKSPKKRLLISAPMTGLVRSEWVLARYGQVVPCNWSMTDATVIMDSYSPMGFLVAEARNLACNVMIKENFEWLLFIDHDVILPPDFFLKINDIMIGMTYPVWGGLYFTKSVPSEPLMYRGIGSGHVAGWHFGDKVWVDGMGLGCHLIHRSVIEPLWNASEEYKVDIHTCRKVFESPARVWFDPEAQSWAKDVGTEDLYFYQRIIKEGVLKKEWPEFAKKKYPFMCDTGCFCRHIDDTGRQFPISGEEMEYIKPIATKKVTKK